MTHDGDTKVPGFDQRTLMLPVRVWDLVDDLARTSNKEPGEIVAEAVRMLVATGGVLASPASIAGPSREPSAATSPRAMAGIADLGGGSISPMLAALHAEELGSDRLREGLTEIMTTVEQKDHFIKQHSKEVAALSLQIARQLEMDDRALQVVEAAALTHDVGKSRVPAEILGKKGRLTQDEWELVKQYPQFSAEIVAEFANLADVVPAVRHHQERWDGSGYPDGLREDEIPLAAQIVGLCDVYDVLTSDRAYRPALPPDIARRTIESGIGRLWNPKLAELLLSMIDAK